MHGVLDKDYLSELLDRLFGTGQGNGGSPHSWLAVSDVLLRCNNNKLYGIKMLNPTGTFPCEQNEDDFVDDSGLTVDIEEEM